jgi:hypothetical protein
MDPQLVLDPIKCECNPLPQVIYSNASVVAPAMPLLVLNRTAPVLSIVPRGNRAPPVVGPIDSVTT